MQLRELSDTDQLTRLFNRRKLECELTLHYETFKRHAMPMSILIFDLDHLKKINDSLGHHAGDEVILAVGDICRVALRKTDIACRFGGDEFVVVLPNTDLEHAVQFADRLRECFNQELSRFSMKGVAVTVSIGVAIMLPTDRTYEDALKRADNALYDAKRLGKNQVCSTLSVS
jgi:diguanylate cyclase (GGDEF)-like protein